MKKFFVYFLSFTIPLNIVAIAWAVVGFYPFGNETIMAIDFGNQYIDLFNFMRETILSGDFSALFHSFSKSIGGSTVGLWAYYLMSPLNLLYLLFPKEHIALPATLTVFLRYGLMALTMAYYLDRRQLMQVRQRKLIPIFATIYALSGFTVSYQMNPLFMDALIFLPLIILALEELLDGERPHKYVLFLLFMIVFHFYMAFMIAIFIVIYSLYYLAIQDRVGNWKSQLKTIGSKFFRMILYSAMVGGLLAVFILPVFFNLVGSKGELQSGMNFEWAFQMNPLDVVAKLFIGAFDNTSWSAGPNLPNIYVGSLPIAGLILYYFSSKISVKEKIGTLYVFGIFFISIVHKFTNQLWHMGQSPAGFFYRFSFLISFMIIILAFRYFVRDDKVNYLHLFLIASILLLGITIVYPQDYSFLEPVQMQLTSLFLGLVIIGLLPQSGWKWLWIGLVVFTELGVNMGIIQSRLNYTNEMTFRNAIEITDEVISEIRPQDNEFYRTHNLFYRSKNDPFMQDFYGTTNFSSNLENHTRTFFDNIGSNGINAATTYNGTLVTDALLGIRYFVDDKVMLSDEVDSTVDYIFRDDFIRNDIENNLPRIHEDFRFEVYEGESYLPIGFVVGQEMIDTVLYDRQPVGNHEMIAQGIVPNTDPYFTQVDVNMDYTNFEVIDNEDSLYITKDVSATEGVLTIRFTPDSDNSYYVQLPSDLRRNDNNQNSFRLNGSKLPLITNFNVPQLVNIASNEEGEEIILEITTQASNQMNLSDLAVVEFQDNTWHDGIADRSGQGLEVTEMNQRYIKGDVTVAESDQYIMTSIPYDEGWEVKVDGEVIDSITVLDTFLAFPIKAGDHVVELKFTPPGLIIGAIASAIMIPIYYFVSRWEERRRLAQKNQNQVAQAD